MVMLTLGIVLFAAVHFIPSLAPGLKENWVSSMGENGYKGMFSLLLLAAMALIVFGWRSASPGFVYAPPPGLHLVALALMVLAFGLFIVSNRESRLRLLIRHPQLTGVALWGVAHLMVNGDSRSLALFGGLTLWAVGEILAINRREGTWIKGEAPPWSTEIGTAVVTVVVVVILVWVHPWIAGVPVR